MPLDVQTHLWFVHKENVRLAVLHQHRQQYDEHLLLSARELVRGNLLAHRPEEYLIVVTADGLARILEEAIYEVHEVCLLLSHLAGQLLCIGHLAGEDSHHAVAHVHLVIEIVALQLVELQVEFRLGHLAKQVARHERAVEGAYDIEIYRIGILG